MRIVIVLALAIAACAPARLSPAPPRCPAGMIALPAGSFRMGSAAGEPGSRGDEAPAHRVELSAYCLDAHEVTENEYSRVRPGYSGTGCAECPVVAITWQEASDYCAHRDGSGAGGARLPTEAEFERAARAGSATIYPWGNSWPPPHAEVNGRDRRLAAIEPSWVAPEELAYDDGSAGLAPVCAHPANRLGFCDLLGNAAEWCADRWSPGEYSLARSRDPLGPEVGRARVVRGGSFVDGAQDLRPAARTGLDGVGRSALVGMRCAAAPLAPEPLP